MSRMTIYASAGTVPTDYGQASGLGMSWSILQKELPGSFIWPGSPPRMLINRWSHKSNAYQLVQTWQELPQWIYSSEIPTWRAPAPISQIFCCEGGSDLSQSPCLMLVRCLKPIHCLIYLHDLSGEIPDHTGNYEFGCAHRYSPATQLYHNYNDRTCLNFTPVALL